MNKNYFLLVFTILFIISLVFIFGKQIDQNLNILPAFMKKPFSLGMDIAGGTILTYQIDTTKIKDQDLRNVSEQVKDLIERRINFLGVGEFFTSFSASGRVLVEIPNIKDPDAARKIIGETPFLDFRVPLAVGTTTTGTEIIFIPTQLTGQYIKTADFQLDPYTSQPIVVLSFNEEGAKIFKQLTEKYLGQPIAIFLDNMMISAPRVEEVISEGQARITGNFTIDEARTLASRLKQGALPAPLELLSVSIVNPLISKSFIDVVIRASIIGVVLVILFMIIFYRFYGLLASIALIFFIVFNLALYKILGVTISLASLSGLILAIGMAVDANILIFERMREERQRGAKGKDLIETGFSRAFPSIRDSNMTTIISSLLIYFLATSFVKGFALTLFFGVLISFLTAVFFSRNLIEIFHKNSD
ncbi:MAG: protein translocase subunit SecD [Patescibacteria group bacterium]|nr:protein translocase subunit SecD [Patescibacteria group bacterium]